jgi:hypothetical protein
MFGISRKAKLLLASAWLLIGLLVTGQWLVDRPRIQIEWQTETEFDSAGFNLLRSQAKSGPYVKVNERLIPASDDAAAGADYSFLDGDVIAGQEYYYQLEDVDLTGNARRHPPIAFVAPDRPYWQLAIGVASLLIALRLIVSLRASARQGQHT